MKYFLDFDGVIFDIEAFKAHMEALGFAHAPRSASLFTDMQAKDSTFEVSSFIFPDAAQFLHEHKEDSFVVSSYVSSNPLLNQNEEEAASYQEKKIELSGITTLLGRERIHVVGTSKQAALRMLQEACTHDNEPCMFIDDTEAHVRDALHLGIEAVLMNRHGKEISDLRSFASFNDVAR